MYNGGPGEPGLNPNSLYVNLCHLSYVHVNQPISEPRKCHFISIIAHYNAVLLAPILATAEVVKKVGMTVQKMAITKIQNSPSALTSGEVTLRVSA